MSVNLYIRIVSEWADSRLVLRNFNHKIGWRHCLWPAFQKLRKSRYQKFFDLFQNCMIFLLLPNAHSKSTIKSKDFDTRRIPRGHIPVQSLQWDKRPMCEINLKLVTLDKFPTFPNVPIADFELVKARWIYSKLRINIPKRRDLYY